MMMVGSLVSLFASLVVGSIGQEVLKRYLGFSGDALTARVIAIVISTIGLFVFLASAYYVLTNADLTLREVLPGAITAAVILEATFQLLPVYVDISKHNPVLQTLSGPAVLLVWLYLMANVIVLGAEVNWWRGNRAMPTDLSFDRPSESRSARAASARVSAAPSSRRRAERRFAAHRAERRSGRTRIRLFPAGFIAIVPSRTPRPGSRRASGESSTSSATYRAPRSSTP